MQCLNRSYLLAESEHPIEQPDEQSKWEPAEQPKWGNAEYLLEQAAEQPAWEPAEQPDYDHNIYFKYPPLRPRRQPVGLYPLDQEDRLSVF